MQLLMKSLVVAEHAAGRIRRATRSAIEFARQIDTSPVVLVLGHGPDAEEAAADASRFAPALLADDLLLSHPLADRYAHVIAGIVREQQFHCLAAAASTFSKDVIARAAGLLGGAMASDVVGHEVRDGALVYRRPMYAGNVVGTIKLNGTPQIVTVRPSAYAPAAPAEKPWPRSSVAVDPVRLPRSSEFESLKSRLATRPDLTESRVVVSGGRAIKSSEEFERIVGALADRLGGAAGCTRALVDAGIAPNDLQVGQTGKIVAPDLYIALGLSGAVQHTAGMKNAKLVVAINNDPQAPIFEFANYGLVADVREAVPRLLEELAK
jgi:electron transfer flavoprotein alpha subunit